MNEDKSNEQVDDDILQCKADILRARDIIPDSAPYKKKAPPPQEQKKTEADGQTTPVPAPGAKENRQKNKIPRFDLAEEIMAEHRRNTAAKRKAPGQKPQPQSPPQQPRPFGYTIEQPSTVNLEQEKIITEIVGRDIERLCRGNTSDL